MNDFCNHSFLLFCYHSSLVYDRTVEIIFTANRSSGRQCIFPHPSDLDFLSHFFQLNLQEAIYQLKEENFIPISFSFFDYFHWFQFRNPKGI